MNTQPWVILFAIVGLLLYFPNEANATAWGDYFQTAQTVSITSTSENDTTVLRSVTVVCPKAGYLIATASVEFNIDSPSGLDYGSIGYSITPDRTAPISYAPGHFYLHEAAITDSMNFIRVPGSIQRADRCAAGQTVVYNFVAWRKQAVSAEATKPRLYVLFIDTRI